MFLIPVTFIRSRHLFPFAAFVSGCSVIFGCDEERVTEGVTKRDICVCPPCMVLTTAYLGPTFLLNSICSKWSLFYRVDFGRLGLTSESGVLVLSSFSLGLSLRYSFRYLCVEMDGVLTRLSRGWVGGRGYWSLCHFLMNMGFLIRDEVDRNSGAQSYGVT